MKKIVLAVGILSLVFGSTALALDTVIFSSQDAEIMQSGNANKTVDGTNYGAREYMTENWNGPYGNPSTTLFPNTSNSYGLVRFDFSLIPAGSTIQSASLSLYAQSAASWSGSSIALYRVTSDWSESSVTYNTRPTWVTTSPTIMPVGVANGVYFSTDVTALVQDWFSGAYANYGLITQDLNVAAGGGRRYIRFTGKEFAGTDFDPKLTINYSVPTVTPEPVSMVLFGLGAGVLGLAQLRRKKK